MNVVLYDDEHIWKSFLPITFTRPLSEIRIGILTLKEKWELCLGVTCSCYTQPYLRKKYPALLHAHSIYINSKFSPNKDLGHILKNLLPSQALYKGEQLLAFCGDEKNMEDHSFLQRIQYSKELLEINNVWDLFQKNAEAIRLDFELITSGRSSAPLSSSVTVIGDKRLIFLEEGAQAEACVLNTVGGPIYLGKNSEVMEGSAVRGPFSLGEKSTLKLGTKIYGATTIGPHCKIGGEVTNSVILGYSNKAHDGFLGNSVIGEWCNLGADTNNSNLKNNYGEVKLFNYEKNKQVDTGLQFCGLIMGDHSKSGINTMFNTGTVVGVGCNIYGGGFPSTHIPDFSWGGSEGIETHRIEKLFETAAIVYERRGLSFTETDREILKEVFERTVEDY
ncbi:MAG: GlmU family protein [bacterium]|nr:GlmU family protein [bacterium]